MVGVLYSVFCVFFTSIYYLAGDRDGWNHVKYVLYSVYHQVYLYYMDKTGRVGGEGPGGWALEVK